MSVSGSCVKKQFLGFGTCLVRKLSELIQGPAHAGSVACQFSEACVKNKVSNFRACSAAWEFLIPKVLCLYMMYLPLILPSDFEF